MSGWKVKRNDVEYPVSGPEELRAWFVAGNVGRADYVYNPTLGRWMYAHELTELEGVLPKVEKRSRAQGVVFALVCGTIGIICFANGAFGAGILMFVLFLAGAAIANPKPPPKP